MRNEKLGMRNVMMAFLLIGLFAVMCSTLVAQNTTLPRLAVVEFTPNIRSEKTNADAITVRNLVESQMVGTRKYEIITRDDIDKLLENQKIQVSSISSAENLKKLELQNISYIVTGSLDAMGSDYAITVRVLDVSTGKFSHSDNDLMGSGSRELYNGINNLMTKFVAGMPAIRGNSTANTNSTGISIEVTTKVGGALYFQNEEIATLWDNDTHAIPIDRPGTYTVKMVYGNELEETRSVIITSRGITRVDFLTPSQQPAFEQKGMATQNMQTNGFSAAHPSLPIGSKVIVRNNATGKEIEVTIVGRIPATADRIIDLSPGASIALDLGFGGPVTILVNR